MLERLAHRGPDDRGTVQVNGSWLGHRRLSIVDVGGGRSRCRPPTADAFLVGNGEVYNHEDVRAAPRRAASSLTTSDNEVALHLIDERGPEALRRLNGMFAFVMAGRGRPLRRRARPRRDQAAVLGRSATGATVRFASEMHAFDAGVAGVRRAVPARLRVDAGGRPGRASPRRCPTRSSRCRPATDLARAARARR